VIGNAKCKMQNAKWMKHFAQGKMKFDGKDRHGANRKRTSPLLERRQNANA
jgi:hypothetical protein